MLIEKRVDREIAIFGLQIACDTFAGARFWPEKTPVRGQWLKKCLESPWPTSGTDTDPYEWVGARRLQRRSEKKTKYVYFCVLLDLRLFFLFS